MGNIEDALRIRPMQIVELALATPNPVQHCRHLLGLGHSPSSALHFGQVRKGGGIGEV
jgi:hypothetical protein